jgi:hypothetical protein
MLIKYVKNYMRKYGVIRYVVHKIALFCNGYLYVSDHLFNLKYIVFLRLHNHPVVKNLEGIFIIIIIIIIICYDLGLNRPVSVSSHRLFISLRSDLSPFGLQSNSIFGNLLFLFLLHVVSIFS